MQDELPCRHADSADRSGRASKAPSAFPMSRNTTSCTSGGWPPWSVVQSGTQVVQGETGPTTKRSPVHGTPLLNCQFSDLRWVWDLKPR